MFRTPSGVPPGSYAKVLSGTVFGYFGAKLNIVVTLQV